MNDIASIRRIGTARASRRAGLAVVLLIALGATMAEPARAATAGTAGWSEPACGRVARIPIPFTLGLSDDGLVAGYDNRLRAVSWHSRTEAFRWYGGIEGGLPSEITAVSPGGRVAGVATIRGPRYDVRKAVRIEGPLPLVPIDRSPDRYDQVNGVNDANTVVGTSQVGSPRNSQAFRWSDRREVLAPPPGTWSNLQAWAVNGEGRVIGRAYGTDGSAPPASRTLAWAPDGTVTVLPSLGDGADLVPVHIADSGRITGYRLDRSGQGDAVVTWTPGAGHRVAPAPRPNGTAVNLQVSDATEDGTVLGAIFDPQADPALRPFRHDPVTGFHLLVDSGTGQPLPSVPQALNARHEALVTIAGRPHLWRPCA